LLGLDQVLPPLNTEGEAAIRLRLACGADLAISNAYSNLTLIRDVKTVSNFRDIFLRMQNRIKITIISKTVVYKF
jgi:hypothetical protein